jgi:predicted nucleotidyltransferase
MFNLFGITSMVSNVMCALPGIGAAFIADWKNKLQNAQSPSEIREVIEELKSNWDDIKDKLSESEKAEILQKINSTHTSTDELSDEAISDIDNSEYWNSEVDIVSDFDYPEEGIFESVGGFISDLID